MQKGKSGMKWVKFRIKTVTDAEDIIISMLYEIGLEGAQIEDKVPLTALEKEQMFVDILPDGPEDDGIAYLNFFVEEQEDGSLLVNEEPTTREAVLASVEEELSAREALPWMKQRISTGLTTGSSISISFILMIFW